MRLNDGERMRRIDSTEQPTAWMHPRLRQRLQLRRHRVHCTLTRRTLSTVGERAQRCTKRCDRSSPIACSRLRRRASERRSRVLRAIARTSFAVFGCMPRGNRRDRRSSRAGDDRRRSAKKFFGAFTRRWGAGRRRRDAVRVTARDHVKSRIAYRTRMVRAPWRTPETRATARFPGFPPCGRRVHGWTSIRINVLDIRRADGCIFSLPGGVGEASAGVRELLVSPQKFVDTRLGQ